MLIKKFALGMVQANSYVIINEDSPQCFIVDVPDSPKALIDYIKKEALNVTAILLTHGHFDHALGVLDFINEIKVPVFAHALEAETLQDPKRNLSTAFCGQTLSMVADRLLQDGETFTLAGFEIKAIHLPGHTPGGCCYYLAEENVVFTGDTLFQHSVGRSDFLGGDEGLLKSSIQKQLFTLPLAVSVYAGHGDVTTIGIEKSANPYLY